MLPPIVFLFCFQDTTEYRAGKKVVPNLKSRQSYRSRLIKWLTLENEKKLPFLRIGGLGSKNLHIKVLVWWYAIRRCRSWVNWSSIERVWITLHYILFTFSTWYVIFFKSFFSLRFSSHLSTCHCEDHVKINFWVIYFEWQSKGHHF